MIYKKIRSVENAKECSLTIRMMKETRHSYILNLGFKINFLGSRRSMQLGKKKKVWGGMTRLRGRH